jgi:hypothetical protein
VSKKPIIVAVGSPDDLRSLVWRLWVQGDEIYFGARDMLQSTKVSLHKSGIWRIAWVRSLNSQDKSTDRVAVKWRRPDEFAPGLINGVMVLVSPFQPEHPFRNRRIEDDRTEWLPVPQHGKILALIVIIAKRDEDLDSRFDGSIIVGCIKKKNGENVCLIAHEMDLTAAIAERMKEEKSKIKIHVKGDPNKLNATDRTRALFVVPSSTQKEMPAIYDVPLGYENVVSDGKSADA